jgi:hypothetical protein
LIREIGTDANMTRMRWQRLAIAVAGMAALLVLATLVVFTDVGVPRDRYTSPPDPCELVHEPTVRELVGDITLDASFAGGSPPAPPKRGLTREAAVRTCTGATTEATGGSLTAFAYRFYSTQFRLGRDGEARAADQFTIDNELFRDQYRSGCSYDLRSDRGDVCGMHEEGSLRLHVQRANLLVSISIRFPASVREPPGSRLEVLMAALTEEVLSELDNA